MISNLVVDPPDDDVTSLLVGSLAFVAFERTTCRKFASSAE